MDSNFESPYSLEARTKVKVHSINVNFIIQLYLVASATHNV